MDRKEVTGRMDEDFAGNSGHALPLPATDDLALAALLGAKGYHDDVPLYQYAAWADQTGMFRLLAERDGATLEDIVAATPLTEPGAEALIGVLASLSLVTRQSHTLSLSALAGEYLVDGRPYYMGDSLFLTCRRPLPAAFVKKDAHCSGRHQPSLSLMFLQAAQNRSADRRRPGAGARLLKKLGGWEFGGMRMLENQHSRNFPAAAAAAHLPIYDDVKCMVDMAGGSGTFSIPFSRHYPGTRIILTELPQALPGARRFLRHYGAADRVELVGIDVFAAVWPIPECDAIFFGNFFHGFDDDRCRSVIAHCSKTVRPGGKILLHELVWNENKDGPLKTALFNVTMRAYGGRQRTVTELRALIKSAGFVDTFALPTSGGFAVVGGVRSR